MSGPYCIEKLIYKPDNLERKLRGNTELKQLIPLIARLGHLLPGQ